MEEINANRFFWDSHCPKALRHEREISNAGRKKLDFAEKDKFKQVRLRHSLNENLEKPLMSLYGTEWRELGYGFCVPTFMTHESQSSAGICNLLGALESIPRNRFRQPM
jgi:hypothetical protein